MKKRILMVLLIVVPFFLTGCTIEDFGKFPLILILLIPAALITFWIFKYTYVKLKRKGFFYWIKRYLLFIKKENKWYNKIREAIIFKKTLIEKNKTAADALKQRYSGSKFCAAYFRKDSKEYKVVNQVLKNIVGKKDPKKPGLFKRFFGIKTLIAFNADIRSILGNLESQKPFAKKEKHVHKDVSKELKEESKTEYENFYKEFKIEELLFKNLLDHLEKVVEKHSKPDLAWLQNHKKEIYSLEGEFEDAKDLGKHEDKFRNIKEKQEELNKRIERMETSDTKPGGLFPAIKNLILERKKLHDALRNFVMIIEKENKVLEKERDLLEEIKKLGTRMAEERKPVDQYLQDIDRNAGLAEELYAIEIREFEKFWAKTGEGKKFNDYLKKIVVQEAKRKRNIIKEMQDIIGETLSEGEGKNVYTISNFNDKAGFKNHRTRIEELLSRISYNLNDTTIKRIYETKIKGKTEDDAIIGLNECLDYIIKRGKKA